MADQRITQLVELSQAAASENDVLPIADISASETKKITLKNLVAAGIDLISNGEIDIAKIDQGSVTKLGSGAIAPGGITASNLAANSSSFVSTTAPISDNYIGRGFLDTASGNFSVFNGSSFQQVTVPGTSFPDNSIPGAKLVSGSIAPLQLGTGSVETAKIADLAVATGKLAASAVTTDKIADLAITSPKFSPGAVSTNAIAANAVTYSRIQATSAPDVILGRFSGGVAGQVEEIPCTAVARALLAELTVQDQRDALGLGTLALATGTWVDGSSFSGVSTGTNTGDQVITLTGAVTGTGTGTFATAISTSAVTADSIATGAVTSAKIADFAVTSSKVSDNSVTVVNNSAPSGGGAFIGQHWLNTTSAIEYTWSGAAWLQQSGITSIGIVDSTPISLSVAYPDPYSATLTTTLDPQGAGLVWAGPVSGADATPSFRALLGTDLPLATISTVGAVKPGGGLQMGAAVDGTLEHANSVTGATVSGITFDAHGHISAAVALQASDIPSLDASKIGTGSISVDRIAAKSITSAKLADYATAQLGETLPPANFIGEIFLNPLDKTFFMWDGNVWVPIGISAGQVVFAGTYNATTNLMASVTSDGSAIGLTVGQPLPSAGSSNSSYYVVVSIGGTGVAPAPAVTLAPPDIILSNGTTWVEVDVSSTYVAQTASNVGFTPAASLGSTTVQGALEEVSTECRNADNITSGILVVARGGTGLTTYAKGDLVAGNASNVLAKLTLGTNGQRLTVDTTTATGLKWETPTVYVSNVSSSTAALTVTNPATTPALAIRSATTSVNGIVQLSDSTSTTSSTLAATPTAVKAAYDLAAAALPATGGLLTGDLQLGVNIGVVFEGATNDGFETRIYVADPTADRDIVFPDAGGTVALTSQFDDGTF